MEGLQNKDITAKMVQAGEYKGYLAVPEKGEDLPGVIIIHEIFGLNENIKEIACRFAAEGYAGLALDIYSKDNIRALCVFKTIVDLQTNILKSRHMAALDGATKFLQAHPKVNEQKVGVIGFCMGGGFALALAVHNSELKAASVFYGINPKPLNSIARACPVVGSYPDKDFTTPSARKLEKTLVEYQVPHDIKIYPGTKHSFFNNKRVTYNQPAAEDAWQRTLTFFKENF